MRGAALQRRPRSGGQGRPAGVRAPSGARPLSVSPSGDLCVTRRAGFSKVARPPASPRPHPNPLPLGEGERPSARRERAPTRGAPTGGDTFPRTRECTDTGGLRKASVGRGAGRRPTGARAPGARPSLSLLPKGERFKVLPWRGQGVSPRPGSVGRYGAGQRRRAFPPMTQPRSSSERKSKGSLPRAASSG